MGKKAPKAPDPYQTAAAQGGMNRDTAMTQQMMNMANQVNPWGSTSYSPDGFNTFVDSQGKTVSVPKFTQTTTFTPEQQAIFDQSQQAQSNMAGIAAEQSGRIQELWSDPFAFDNQDAANWAYDLGQQRIAPQQQMAQRDLEARLTNSGIRPGTAAWDREMQRMTNANTDQNNQLALQGRSQAFGEAMATRNQPMNELAALLSGSQVVNPATQSPGTPQTSVGGVDYTGLVNQKYQGDLANYQSRMGGLGGLFGLAGNIATGGFNL